MPPGLFQLPVADQGADPQGVAVEPHVGQPGNPVDVDDEARSDVAVGQFQQQALAAGQYHGVRLRQCRQRPVHSVRGNVPEWRRFHTRRSRSIVPKQLFGAGRRIGCIMKANIRTGTKGRHV